MKEAMSRRHHVITAFVILWTLVFHYETLRLHYLSPLVGYQLPKVKFLFPPAGWIMFFSVEHSYGFAEVYGLRDKHPERLDPHAIFETTAVGYDNIHRNVLVSLLEPDVATSCCPFLARKFPAYPEFAVVYAVYPDVVAEPERVVRYLAYRCPARGG